MLCKNCGPGKIGEWLFSRNRFLFDIFYGIKSRIPFCCVIEWSIRMYFYKLGDAPMAIAVGCMKEEHITTFRENDKDWPCKVDYVHCWIHRKVFNHV